MTIIERIARVLAGQHYSRNADGHVPAGVATSDIVDARWRDYVDDATAVLRTLREPDAEMVQAASGISDPAQIWESMVRAAVAETVSD